MSMVSSTRFLTNGSCTANIWMGYVNSEPVTITHNDGKQTIKYNTKWTQKGRFFLYEFLKEKGILPLIERNNNGETH